MVKILRLPIRHIRVIIKPKACSQPNYKTDIGKIPSSVFYFFNEERQEKAVSSLGGFIEQHLIATKGIKKYNLKEIKLGRKWFYGRKVKEIGMGNKRFKAREIIKPNFEDKWINKRLRCIKKIKKDYALLVDVSGSINEGDKEAKVKGIAVSMYKKGTSIYAFNDYTTKVNIEALVNIYPTGGTRINNALKEVMEKEKKKDIVVITDGEFCLDRKILKKAYYQGRKIFFVSVNKPIKEAKYMII